MSAFFIFFPLRVKERHIYLEIHFNYIHFLFLKIYIYLSYLSIIKIMQSRSLEHTTRRQNACRQKTVFSASLLVFFLGQVSSPYEVFSCLNSFFFSFLFCPLNALLLSLKRGAFLISECF